MRTKLFYLFAAALIAGTTGCNDNEPDPTPTPDSATLDIRYGGEVDNSLSIDEIAAEGDEYEITVTSNRAWAMEALAAEVDWVTVSPTSGEKGEEPVTVTITVGANANESGRDIDLVFKTTAQGEEEALTRTVTLEQKGSNVPPPPPATLDITYDGDVENELSIEGIPAEGDEITISISSNRDWAMTPLAADIDWVTVSPTSGQKDTPTTVTITVAASEVEEIRSVQLVFTTDDEDLSRTVSLSQAAYEEPYVEVFTSVEANFMGDLMENGTTAFNPVTFNGPDIICNFPRVLSEPCFPGEYRIPEGTYTGAPYSDWSAGTFGLNANNTHLTRNGEKKIITGGTFVVSYIDDENYKVVFNLPLNDGTTFEATYKGAITMLGI